MFDHLGPAMRRALSAARASDPAEATRLLQEALGGLPAQDGTMASAKRRSLGETLAAMRNGSEVQLRPTREPLLPDGSTFLKRSIKTSSGARDFRLFVPSSTRPHGLIVMLHGCKQTAEDFAVGTTMNRVAEEEGMLVAYPTQARSANPSGCWNWFRPEDQGREAGEPHIIAEMTRALAEEYAVGPRVFVAGLSAGGAMAAVMGATYPELYQATGIHSGLPYRSARDVNSALAAMRGDHHRGDGGQPGAFLPRQIVFHGSQDHTVVPSNAKVLTDWVRHDRDTAKSSDRRFVSGSRPVQHTEIMGRDGTVRAETWLVEGAGHHWFGGDPAGSYAKPDGPNASKEMMRFFLRRQLRP